MAKRCHNWWQSSVRHPLALLGLPEPLCLIKLFIWKKGTILYCFCPSDKQQDTCCFLRFFRLLILGLNYIIWNPSQLDVNFIPPDATILFSRTAAVAFFSYISIMLLSKSKHGIVKLPPLPWPAFPSLNPCSI